MLGSVELKSDDQIRTMRRAGLITRAALEAARAACVPGATTADVDAAGARVIEEAGARSNFLGYHGYPATLCVSVNEVVVHGIPGDRVLEPGDMVSIDGGAIVDGFHGDSALTVFVGGEEQADPAHVRLSQVTGRKVGDIGAAIEARAQELAPDLGLIEDFTGHGIGTQMHMDPEVLNYDAKRKGPKLRPGMCLAIEPMLVAGDIETQTLADDWTVVTVDGSRASHWEHSVARHAGGIWVLTAEDGGAERLAPYGVTPVALD